MFPELSLHVLDIAENSVRAGAEHIEMTVCADVPADVLTIEVRDDGHGMSKEQIAQVADPFYTTRATRRVGLGVPFLKQACEQTGGSLAITSKEGQGTMLTARLILSSIDRMPLGDMVSTVASLVISHEDRDFVYRFRVVSENAGAADNELVLDTAQMRTVLEGVAFHTPEVSRYIREYLEKNTQDVLETAGLERL